MKIVHIVLLSYLITLPLATLAEEAIAPSVHEEETSEFIPNETPGAGFITNAINSSLEKTFENIPVHDEKPQLGRTLTDLVSAPKIGGYFVGRYLYSDQKSEHSNEGFSQRYLRLYLDGSILNDFKYRVQLQMNNSTPHMKDFYLEWTRWKAFSIRMGQFKRAFTFENPYNAWNVGFGDYSQVVKKLSGMGDYCGEQSTAGGRDQGIQIQGDLFPSKKDGHHFLHYQFQVMNGQGVNAADQNKKKDFLGTLQIQPVKDLFIGVFGWNGNFVSDNGVTVNRNRWATSVKYEHNDWSLRAEYAHSHGHKIDEFDKATGKFTGTGKADGWYTAIGIPFNPWLKIYARYDVYRHQATWDSAKTIYSIAPNFQIHKNILFQVQYDYVHDHNTTERNHNDFWVEMYVRF